MSLTLPTPIRKMLWKPEDPIFFFHFVAQCNRTSVGSHWLLCFCAEAILCVTNRMPIRKDDFCYDKRIQIRCSLQPGTNCAHQHCKKFFSEIFFFEMSSFVHHITFNKKNTWDTNKKSVYQIYSYFQVVCVPSEIWKKFILL